MFFESLKGRTVVITGAAGGIGVPLAHYCQQAGADLLLLDRNFEGLRKLTAKPGRSDPQRGRDLGVGGFCRVPKAA